jgi:predicted transcriptional regulator
MLFFLFLSREKNKLSDLYQQVSNILDAANGEGETKTKIMYFAFLSYNQLNEYLSILIENNLLEYLDGTRTFKTTEKGLNYIKRITKWEYCYNKLLISKNN